MAKMIRFTELVALIPALCFVPAASAAYLNVVDLPDLNGGYSYGQGAVSQTVSIEQPLGGPWWGTALTMVGVEFEVQGVAGSDSVLGEVYPEFMVSVRDPEGVDLIETTLLGPIGNQVTSVEATKYWSFFVAGFWPPSVSGQYEVTLEMPGTYPDLLSSPVLEVLSGTITVQYEDNDGFVGLSDLDKILGHWNQAVEPYDFSKGELTGDGFVGLADLDVILANWNNGTPPVGDGGFGGGCGDPNGDCYIGLGDLDIMLNSWNLTVPPGDPRVEFTADNFVGLDDLDILLNLWNKPLPPVASVPEPGTILIGIVCGGLVTHRRRR